MKLLSKDFLGERLVPEVETGTVQYFDHIRRYLFAQQFVCRKRVLDIACGTGYGSDILRRGRAAAVFSADISAEAVHYAADRWPDARLLRADALNLPLPSAAFDVIVSFETVEHLPDPRRFLIEARRVLKGGGMLILSTPNRLSVSPGSAKPYSPYHTFEPTRDELIALLTETGWTVDALYSMIYSPRAQTVVQPAHAPYKRVASQIAWSAYLRLLILGMLPPFAYHWLRRIRHIPELDTADSVLTCGGLDEAAYFIAVCRQENNL